MFLFFSMGVNAYLFYRWSQETDKKRFLLHKIVHEEKQNPLFSSSNAWVNKFAYVFPIKDGMPIWYTNELKEVKKDL